MRRESLRYPKGPEKSVTASSLRLPLLTRGSLAPRQQFQQLSPEIEDHAREDGAEALKHEQARSRIDIGLRPPFETKSQTQEENCIDRTEQKFPRHIPPDDNALAAPNSHRQKPTTRDGAANQCSARLSEAALETGDLASRNVTLIFNKVIIVGYGTEIARSILNKVIIPLTHVEE